MKTGTVTVYANSPVPTVALTTSIPTLIIVVNPSPVNVSIPDFGSIVVPLVTSTPFEPDCICFEQISHLASLPLRVVIGTKVKFANSSLVLNSNWFA